MQSLTLIGFEILTVLSAINGIRVAVPNLHHSESTTPQTFKCCSSKLKYRKVIAKCVADVTVIVSCFILLVLFGLQHIGTRRVSSLFAPVILAWLVCNASIGVYNLIKWNPDILRALSPYYMYYFFKMDGKEGWIALGGVLLSITGLCIDSPTCDMLHLLCIIFVQIE